MLYINNEQVKEKDKKLFSEFRQMFGHNLDDQLRIKGNNPFILKYKPSMVKDDPDNPGKKLMNQSVPLKLVSVVNIDGQMTEVRYSSTSPKATKEGPVFPASVIQVERGSMAIYDIDLAFYIWAYSLQNFEKYPDRADAFFVIENAEAERLAFARAMRDETTAKARIWNDVQDGGLSDERLRYVAKGMMIRDAADMDINQLRQIIGTAIQVNKGNKANRDLFLNLSDPYKNAEEKKQAENYADRRSVITEAIANELISHQPAQMKFSLNDENYVPKDVLFNYESFKKSGDKTPRVELLYLYLEENKPEMIEELEAKIKALKLATA
jgi:hypothetical protein